MAKKRHIIFVLIALVLLVGCGREEVATVELTPIISQSAGVESLVPAGWEEMEPGVYVRPGEPADTVLAFRTGSDMSIDFVLGYVTTLMGLPDIPDNTDRVQTASFEWHCYTAEAPSTGSSELPALELALAVEDSTLYAITLQMPESERETLSETVLRPVLESVRPLARANRASLSRQELLAPDTSYESPVNNMYFRRPPDAGPALHPFEGFLVVPEFTMNYSAGQLPRSSQSLFPAVTLSFFTHDGYLVPAEREIIQGEGYGSYWDVILSPGAVWSEPGDEGMSRAAFPFIMVADDYNEAHNGLGTFLYDEQGISSFYMQVIQETAAWNTTDFWGQTEVDYRPGQLPNRDDLIDDFAAEVAGYWPVRPWSDLEADYDPRLLASFIGAGDLDSVSATGLVKEGTIYLQSCHTRYGAYPFCQNMRHGVFSVTKSLGASFALLRLAEKFGEGVFDLKIANYVDIKSNHDGWRDVTFGDALSMATGVGDNAPSRVEPNIMFGDEDQDRFYEFMQADSAAEKLDLAFRYGDYPWGPGEIVRYNSINTFLLSAAMDAFLKKQEGPEADIWDMVVEEVYRPVGVQHAPIMRTVEADGRRGLPVFGYGLYLTVDEMAKLSQLLHDGGRFEGQQLLHPGKLAEALGQSGQGGLPTGMPSPDGEVRYQYAFYGLPFRQRDGQTIIVPYMSGFGGNIVALYPGHITLFRFSDGFNYDVFSMVRVAEEVSE